MTIGCTESLRSSPQLYIISAPNRQLDNLPLVQLQAERVLKLSGAEFVLKVLSCCSDFVGEVRRQLCEVFVVFARIAP
jgi:hypothetical protein